jgi:predicted Rossmann fold nucleotide-binding protein DprA/Smf involved in DNA uptake
LRRCRSLAAHFRIWPKPKERFSDNRSGGALSRKEKNLTTRANRTRIHPLFIPIVAESAEVEYRTVDVPERVVPFFGRKPSRLWYLGNTFLLSQPLVGIVSARAVDSNLSLSSAALLTQLARLQATFIGGWHSPLETESLRILLSQAPRTIICLAKSVNRFAFLQELKTLLNQDRLLLLTHCSPRAKRISRDAAIRRNHLVAGLAQVVLVLVAPEGSTTFKLARSAINLRKPVFAIEHPINENLLAFGALPATFEGIRKALQ